ncbi:MAG: hypothetical protein U5L45_22945 [Saprospiraceae bacterium]|nr:hypothetical protein [Saprospiraceae bacterium]
MRERSERKTSVFNQKTMFLGYAHSSYINYILLINTYLIFFSLKTKTLRVAQKSVFVEKPTLYNVP